jgi:hypothetical protein
MSTNSLMLLYSESSVNNLAQKQLATITVLHIFFQIDQVYLLALRAVELFVLLFASTK